jgi:hypothetical protein
LKTVLLSALTRQFLVHGARFLELHPHDWLMWEAGTLTVPGGIVGSASTVSEGLGVSAERPRVGDPLCFVLERTGDGTSVTIGRAEGNDIVISDETVSRNHCTLVWSVGGWIVTPAVPGAVVRLEGKTLGHGQFEPMPSGSKLELGHLVFSLHTSHGMALRLAQRFAARR